MYSHVPAYPVTDSPSLSSSVLSSFPAESAHAVVTAVVKTVSGQLGLQIQASDPTVTSSGASATASLKTEAQISWFMEVRNQRKDVTAEICCSCRY